MLICNKFHLRYCVALWSFLYIRSNSWVEAKSVCTVYSHCCVIVLSLADFFCLFTRHRCVSYSKQSSWYSQVSEWQCNGRVVLHQSAIQNWSKQHRFWCVWSIFITGDCRLFFNAVVSEWVEYNAPPDTILVISVFLCCYGLSLLTLTQSVTCFLSHHSVS